MLVALDAGLYKIVVFDPSTQSVTFKMKRNRNYIYFTDLCFLNVVRVRTYIYKNVNINPQLNLSKCEYKNNDKECA